MDGVRLTGVIHVPEWKDDFDQARHEWTLSAVACTRLLGGGITEGTQRREQHG
jgi:hypothetical protein